MKDRLRHQVKSWIARAPTSKVRTACCNRIMGILPSLCLEDKRPIQSPAADEKNSKRGKSEVQVKKSLEDLLDFMLYLEKSKSFSLVVDFEKEEKLARNELRALISKINDKVFNIAHYPWTGNFEMEEITNWISSSFSSIPTLCWQVSSVKSENGSRSKGLVIQKVLQNILVHHLLEPEKLGDVLKVLVLLYLAHSFSFLGGCFVMNSK